MLLLSSMRRASTAVGSVRRFSTAAAAASSKTSLRCTVELISDTM